MARMVVREVTNANLATLTSTKGLQRNLMNCVVGADPRVQVQGAVVPNRSTNRLVGTIRKVYANSVTNANANIKLHLLPNKKPKGKLNLNQLPQLIPTNRDVETFVDNSVVMMKVSRPFECPEI